jgi:hypothetical protein
MSRTRTRARTSLHVSGRGAGWGLARGWCCGPGRRLPFLVLIRVLALALVPVLVLVLARVLVLLSPAKCVIPPFAV